MAKKDENLTPEEIEIKRRELERADREKREAEEKKKNDKIKAKRKKTRSKKRKKKESKEKKRIKKAVDFPYKILNQLSLLAAALFALVIMFGMDIELPRAIFYTFWFFIILYLGVGAVMIGVFYVISAEKIKISEAERLKEEAAQKVEEENMIKEQEELEENLRMEYVRQQELMNASLHPDEAVETETEPESLLDQISEEKPEGDIQSSTQDIQDGLSEQEELPDLKDEDDEDHHEEAFNFDSLIEPENTSKENTGKENEAEEK